MPLIKTVGQLREFLKDIDDDSRVIGYDGSDYLRLDGILVWGNGREDVIGPEGEPIDEPSITISID